MSQPCIICVAITGSLPRKENNPAVPITVEEQVESTQAAFEAGATIAHCHVRNDDQTPSSDPEKFGRLMEGLKKQFSDFTGFYRVKFDMGKDLDGAPLVRELPANQIL